MVTKNIIVSVPSPQVLFLLDVISYTIDLTSYLSLHCYGYVVWWQTCDLQPVLSSTLTLTTYNSFFFWAIPSSSPRPNCFCESYKELQLYSSSSSVIFLVVISLWEMDFKYACITGSPEVKGHNLLKLMKSVLPFCPTLTGWFFLLIMINLSLKLKLSCGRILFACNRLWCETWFQIHLWGKNTSGGGILWQMLLVIVPKLEINLTRVWLIIL